MTHFSRSGILVARNNMAFSAGKPAGLTCLASHICVDGLACSASADSASGDSSAMPSSSSTVCRLDVTWTTGADDADEAKGEHSSTARQRLAPAAPQLTLVDAGAAVVPLVYGLKGWMCPNHRGSRHSRLHLEVTVRLSSNKALCSPVLAPVPGTMRNHSLNLITCILC